MMQPKINTNVPRSFTELFNKYINLPKDLRKPALRAIANPYEKPYRTTLMYVEFVSRLVLLGAMILLVIHSVPWFATITKMNWIISTLFAVIMGEMLATLFNHWCFQPIINGLQHVTNVEIERLRASIQEVSNRMMMSQLEPIRRASGRDQIDMNPISIAAATVESIENGIQQIESDLHMEPSHADRDILKHTLRQIQELNDERPQQLD